MREGANFKEYTDIIVKNRRDTFCGHKNNCVAMILRKGFGAIR
ncbi:uncharacterized protein Dmul_04730 [Desulfococcus multivorans]|nr:uncharacterized protein Dmul_04730 [Desulfococcus multivorans]SKA27110.1 hypothetical protein SAMN02745446_03678 [Desulfococcus multivorans DSM 2059]